MTVSANYEVKTYQGNGITTEFAVPFKFFDDEIDVYADKGNAKYEKGVDYNIINSGNGGAVVFNKAPITGEYITITRNVVLNQMVKFIEGADFPAQDYEYSLDRIIMALQELSQKISRCMLVPAGESLEEYLGRTMKFIYNHRIWKEGEIYEQGELVFYSDGYAISEKIYLSLKNENRDNPENKDSWCVLSYTAAAVDELLKFKANVADVYSKEEVDKKIGSATNIIKKENVSSFGKLFVLLDESSEYHTAGYKYSVDLTVEGAKPDMVPVVVFDVADALSGNFCPVAEALTDSVRVYVKEGQSNFVVKSIVLA